jgi:hypothetical protein
MRHIPSNETSQPTRTKCKFTTLRNKWATLIHNCKETRKITKLIEKTNENNISKTKHNTKDSKTSVSNR